MPFLVLTVLSILATWYTVKDAQKRAKNATGWGAFVMLTTMAGLPIYLLARRKRA